MQAINITDILARALMEDDDENEADDETRPTSLPEARIMMLREISTDYNRGCQFKPGDLVTPKPHVNLVGHGEPYIVLDVIENPEPHFRSGKHDSSAFQYGPRIDIRTATVRQSKSNGTAIVAHWGESWMFTPYTGDGCEEDS